MPNAMAQLIRERRQALGLTQEELAERIGGGARQSEVSRLEGGRVALPRRLRMEQIARALELPLGEILIRSGWVGADKSEEFSTAGSDRDASEPGQGQADRGDADESIDELQELNTDLRTSVSMLQLANDRLRDRVIDRAAELREAEASVEQLRAILNALADAVVVVSRFGVVVVENTAHAVFDATLTDDTAMLDLSGVPIPEDDLPVVRAARGEHFSMEFVVQEAGQRVAYRAEGQPASTVKGGLVGVVTIRHERT